MNLVDVTVVEVIVKPHHRKDGKWTTTVRTTCWGSKQKLEVVEDTLSEVEKYVVGYTWKE